MFGLDQIGSYKITSDQMKYEVVYLYWASDIWVNAFNHAQCKVRSLSQKQGSSQTGFTVVGKQF